MRAADCAVLALGQYDDPAATDTLLRLTSEGRASTRNAAIRALGRRSAPKVTAQLVSLLGENDPAVLLAVCAALGQTKDRTAIKPLVEATVRAARELKNNALREAAGDALEAITGLQYGPFEARWKQALEEGKL